MEEQKIPADELREAPKFRKKKLNRARPRDESTPGRLAHPDAEGTVRQTSREREKEIEKELSEIYENTDGTMPNMKQFEMRKRASVFRAAAVFIVSCAILGTVAWASFFARSPSADFSGDDVELTIEGGDRVRVAEEYRYRIRYHNGSSASLSHALLSVRLPDGFVVTGSSVSTTAEQGAGWQIGTLQPGEGGEIEMAGKFFGAVGEKQSFRIFLNYIPSNFSSEFQKASSFSVEISDAGVDVTIEGPEEVIVGSETEFTVTLHPRDEGGTLPDGRQALRLEAPVGFTQKGADPAFTDGAANEWIMYATGTRQFRFRGIFSPAEGTDHGEIKAVLVGWKDDRREGDGWIFAEDTLPLKFLRTDMAISLVVNGSMNDASVTPGESLHATLAIRNTGDAPLRMVEPRIIIDAPSFRNQSILNWNELSDPKNGAVKGEQLDEMTRRGRVSWDVRHIPALRELMKDEEVLLEIDVPIKNGQEADLGSFIAHLIQIAGEVTYRALDEEKTLATKPLSLIINSDMRLQVRDEVSTVAEGRERHRVSWVLSNTFHDLSNVSLEADIYGDAVLVQDEIATPAGKVSYDGEKKRIRWMIETMPTSVDVLAMQFPILLNSKNPTQTNLMSKVTVRATDTVTKEELVIVGDEILLTKEESGG